MTEMITIIAVGVGLAGLILNGQKNIREQIDQRLDLIGQRLDLMDGRLDQMDKRFDQVDARFEKLEMRMGTMERQQAKLEGLLEGLREAISGRAPVSR
jgi:chaperonin cofactor prefoldin